MHPQSNTPPIVVETRDIHQQQPSPVKVEGGASVVMAAHSGAAGGVDEVLPLKTEQLTATQQAVVSSMEAAGVVSWRDREKGGVNGGARETVE